MKPIYKNKIIITAICTTLIVSIISLFILQRQHRLDICDGWLMQANNDYVLLMVLDSPDLTEEEKIDFFKERLPHRLKLEITLAEEFKKSDFNLLELHSGEKMTNELRESCINIIKEYISKRNQYAKPAGHKKKRGLSRMAVAHPNHPQAPLRKNASDKK